MKFSLTTIFLIHATFLFSQSIERQLIGSTGFSVQLTASGMDCTVGEPMIAFTSTAENMLSQGFLQPDMASDISVHENQSNDLIIFPNPAHDHFFVQSENIMTTLEMYDTAGRLVMKINPNTSGIDIAPVALAQGLYHLKITTTQKVLTKNIQIL